jgi:hypothetical protein
MPLLYIHIAAFFEVQGRGLLHVHPFHDQQTPVKQKLPKTPHIQLTNQLTQPHMQRMRPITVRMVSMYIWYSIAEDERIA